MHFVLVAVKELKRSNYKGVKKLSGIRKVGTINVGNIFCSWLSDTLMVISIDKLTLVSFHMKVLLLCCGVMLNKRSAQFHSNH